MSKSEKNQTSALAIQDSSTIADGLAIIQEELKKLKHIQESVYKTSGTIGGFKNKIENESSITELIKMASSIVGRERTYNEAAESLGLSQYPVFSCDGGKKDEWLADIKLRIDILQTKERYDELKGYEKDLTDLMDKDDKKRILFKKLEKFGAKQISE